MTNPIARIMVDFKQMKQFIEDPLVIERGQGIHLWDVDGKEYIDGLAGVFVASVGHANPTIIESITDQLHKLTFAPPLASTNTAAIALAARLSKLTPPQYNLFKFTSGGSEAIEMAIKMALQYHKQTGNPGKFRFVSAYGAYHGGTLGALSASGTAARRTTFEPLMGSFLHVHPPNFKHCPLGLEEHQCETACVRQFENTIQREGPETVAAVIVEPVMNVEGLIWPPPSYFQRLRDICDRYDVLLIYDEVITGFGRTGTLFFAEQTGVWPDILCCGKGMSGGYMPLGAAIVNDRVAAAFWGEPEDNIQFNAGHTFAGNPISCATGLAVLNYMMEYDLLGKVAVTGPYLRDCLEALRTGYPQIIDVRGLGMWWGVEFEQNESGDIGKRVERAARAHGLIIRGAPNMISFGPPLTITRDEIDVMISRFAAALEDVFCEGNYGTFRK
jgi:adenosylmethionine-8-amino-7-oxononanoate aminotransferase